MSQTDKAPVGTKRKRKSAAPSTPAKVPKTTDESTPTEAKASRKSVATPKKVEKAAAPKPEAQVVETVIKHSSKYKYFENHQRYHPPKEAPITIDQSKFYQKILNYGYLKYPRMYEDFENYEVSNG